MHLALLATTTSFVLSLLPFLYFALHQYWHWYQNSKTHLGIAPEREAAASVDRSKVSGQDGQSLSSPFELSFFAVLAVPVVCGGAGAHALLQAFANIRIYVYISICMYVYHLVVNIYTSRGIRKVCQQMVGHNTRQSGIKGSQGSLKILTTSMLDISPGC